MDTLLRGMTPLFVFIILLAGCGTSEKEARQELANLNIEYSEESFAKRAAQGDERAVNLFLKTSINPKPALISAAAQSQKKIVQKLLDSGVKPPGQALRAPASEGNTKMVKLLLEAGAEPSTRTLRAPVSEGNAEMVKLLLEAGADPGTRTLRAAASKGHAEVVKPLLDAGASPEEDLLLDAAEDGYLQTVNFLLEAGANPNARLGEREMPLYAAAVNGHEEIVRSLLGAGGNPDQIVKENERPVWWYSALEGNIECVKVFAEEDADLNATIDTSPLANRNNQETILDQLASKIGRIPNKSKIAAYLQSQGVEYLDTKSSSQIK